MRATDRRVALLHHDRVDQARLDAALRDSARLIAFDDERALVSAITRQEVGATIIALHRGHAEAAIATIRRLRDRLPSHPLLAYFDERALPSTTTIMEVARAGADDVITRGRDDVRGLLVGILEGATQRVLAKAIHARLATRIDPAVAPIVHFILEQAHQRLTVEGTAEALGVHRRTLVTKLVARGYPPPQVLIGWCRLLLAARLMDERGRTLDSIALQLDFCSVSGLVNQMRRYTGLGTRELRQSAGGAFERVVGAFLDALETPAPALGAEGGRPVVPFGRRAGRRER